MATFTYSFTFSNATTGDGGNIQTDMNDLRTFLTGTVAHSDGTNYPTGLSTFGCRVRRVANQSITSGARTAILQDTIDSDPQGMVSGSTFTIKSAGWYLFSATQLSQTTLTLPVYFNWIFTSGPTLMPISVSGYNENSSSRDTRVVATMLHKCALNETLQIQYLHNNGSAVNVTMNAMIRKVSAL